MAWEERAGNRYYYQSEREGGRVVKRYVGPEGCDIAEAIAHADETIRRVREQRAAKRRERIEALEVVAACVEDLEHAATTLTEAHLIAAGYHKHRGEWRRARIA